MTSKHTRIVVHHEGDVTRIGFVDQDILEEDVIQQIEEEIHHLIDKSDRPKLLISFENVHHLSSAALSTLITVNNKIRQKGGQLRLSDIDPQIYEVFVITRLNNVFQIYPDAAQAMESFS